jgi:hypothetical protein
MYGLVPATYVRFSQSNKVLRSQEKGKGLFQVHNPF